jgi:hypothetical protein
MKHLKPIFEDIDYNFDLTSCVNKIIKDEEEIKSICAGLMDQCHDKSFMKMKLVNSSVQRMYGNIPKEEYEKYVEGYGLILKFKNSGFIATGPGVSIKLTEEFMNVMDELIEVRNRLEDLGYSVYMTNKEYGISLGIYDKKIVEFVQSLKRNPEHRNYI